MTERNGTILAVFVASTALLLAFGAAAEPVKKSSSGICHCPGGQYYARTKNFTPYSSIEKCLAAGGRHPKGGQGDCSQASGTQSEPEKSGNSGSARQFYGPLHIVDGDTIVISKIEIRLHGIDAPEVRQSCRDGRGKTYPCGKRATEALTLLAANGVSCDMELESDRYGRKISTCYAIGGRNVNALMVRMGYALAYRQYSTDYVAEEEKARAARRGIHQGEFVTPWEWRRGKRLP